MHLQLSHEGMVPEYMAALCDDGLDGLTFTYATYVDLMVGGALFYHHLSFHFSICTSTESSLDYLLCNYTICKLVISLIQNILFSIPPTNIALSTISSLEEVLEFLECALPLLIALIIISVILLWHQFLLLSQELENLPLFRGQICWYFYPHCAYMVSFFE